MLRSLFGFVLLVDICSHYGHCHIEKETKEEASDCASTDLATSTWLYSSDSKPDPFLPSSFSPSTTQRTTSTWPSSDVLFAKKTTQWRSPGDVADVGRY